MLHHRTTKINERLYSIADRLEKEREEYLAYKLGENPYHEWAKYWLEQYNQLLLEFCGVEPSGV